MVRWLEAQRLRRVVHRAASTPTARRRAPAAAQGVHVGRPRRVLVGQPARERRGRARRRREPRVLQRQRDLLEDALGAEHRRLDDRVPHARLVQGDARRNAKIDPIPAVDRDVARSALRRRRPTAADPENALAGTIFRSNCCTSAIAGPRPTSAAATSGATRGSPTVAGRRRRCADGSLGYEWDVDLDNGSRPPGQIDLSSTTVDGRSLRTRVRPTRPAPRRTRHAVPRRERRARVRRGHGAVVVGARRHARPRRAPRPTPRCSRRP